MEKETRKPIENIRVGNVQAAIWENQGEKGNFMTASFSRSYEKNGEWSKAVNLGSETNSDKMDYCPFVSLETNTLYFTSKRNKPVLPAKGFSYVKDLLKVMHQYDNGLSRVYAVPIDKVPGWSFNRR